MPTNPIIYTIDLIRNKMTDQEATIKTREHFADLCDKCIQGAKNGEFRVNDLEKYIKQNTESKHADLAGENDHTFTFYQYKHYLLTGNCVALLA